MEDRRINLMKDNALFLKQKIGPLSDKNIQLTERVIVLTSYIEHRRLDFLSLLRRKDETQYADLVNIHRILKEELHEDAVHSDEYRNESMGLRTLLS